MKNIDLLLKANNYSVLVFGDVMLDHYVFGACNRISPEAPVPVFEPFSETCMLGGAGNVMRNLKAFGIHAELVSVLGDDLIGRKISKLIKNYSKLGINGLFYDDCRKSILKKRYVASGQQLLRVDTESRHYINRDFEMKILRYVTKKIREVDLLIISDYDKGVVSDFLCSKIISVAAKVNCRVLVDPKVRDFKKYSGCYLLKPNFAELKKAIGVHEIAFSSLRTHTAKLMKVNKISNFVVTLGSEGVFFNSGKKSLHLPADFTEVSDVSGAGDTVIAALATCLLYGLDIEDACKFANSAASVVIRKFGTGVVDIKTVLNEINLKNEKIYS